VLAAGVILSAFLTRFSPDWTLVYVGAALVMLPFAIGRLIRFDIFEPVYLFALSFGVLFVIRPAFDLLTSSSLPSFVGISARPTYSKALLFAVGGCASFYAGYYLSSAQRWGLSIPGLPDVWNVRRLVVFAMILLALSGILFGLFVLGNGGMPLLSSLLAGRNPVVASALHNSSGYFYLAPLWLTSIALLFIALAPRWRSRLTFAGIGLLALSQLTEIGLGDRSFFLPALAGAVLVVYLKRKQRPPMWLAATAIVLVFVFGINLPRDYRVHAKEGIAAVLRSTVANPGDGARDFFTGADSAMIQGLAIELEYVPSRLNYQWGATYVEALTRPIPRPLWRNKPVAAETQLMETIWPDLARIHVGFAFSVFAEPYLNFGWPGVLVFAFLFGAAWRALYSWYLANSGNITVITTYALSWPFMVVYMRGGLGVDYHRQVIYVFPIILASYLAARGLRAERSHRTLTIDAVRSGRTS